MPCVPLDSYFDGRSDKNILEGEFDWFCIDADDFVGHFSTAGFGPIPLIIQKNIDKYLRVDHFLMKSSGSRRASLLNSDGDRADWLHIAQHGIYSYDFVHWDGPYALIARPEQPIRVSELALDMRETIGLFQLAEVCFSKQVEISLYNVT